MNIKNISKLKVNPVVLPIAMLFVFSSVAFLLGGIALLYDGMSRYIVAAIIGTPVAFVLKKSDAKNKVMKLFNKNK